jgi:hypothetical protein
MNRRSFFRFLGLAPFVPIAAKLPVLKPTLNEMFRRDVLASIGVGEWSKPVPYVEGDLVRMHARAAAHAKDREILEAMLKGPIVELPTEFRFVRTNLL